MIINLHPQLLSPSEEPFALYFYKAYRHKQVWTETELRRFADEFWLIAEKSLALFFTSKERLLQTLLPHRDNLPYDVLLKLIYLNFVEPKPKDTVRLIVDKQIKYFFYLKRLLQVYPAAKFIVLTRDPRVNAQRKRLRQLNSGSSAIYLSALWRNTYRNVRYLRQRQKAVLIVKYEELVSQPEATVRNICAFLDVPFLPQMLKTDGVYESFLKHQQDKLEASHIEHLKDFHSGLFTSINTEKVALKADETDDTVNNKIIRITGPVLREMGYSLDSTKAVRLSLADRFQILKAYLYRPALICVYLHIPLSVKLLIKRIRKRNPNVP